MFVFLKSVLLDVLVSDRGDPSVDAIAFRAHTPVPAGTKLTLQLPDVENPSSSKQLGTWSADSDLPAGTVIGFNPETGEFSVASRPDVAGSWSKPQSISDVLSALDIPGATLTSPLINAIDIGGLREVIRSGELGTGSWLQMQPKSAQPIDIAATPIAATSDPMSVPSSLDSAGDSASQTQLTPPTDGQVFIIDGAVSNYQAIINELGPDAEVYVLSSDADGLDQIEAILDGRSGLDALHIISHGNQGSLTLGNSVVDAQSMQTTYADALASIGGALTETGDLLIYGCDFAAGETGQAAAQLLSDLTGADVAASIDKTGSAKLGGDWELEAEVGIVETTAVSAEPYQYLLQTTVKTFEAGSYVIDMGQAVQTIGNALKPYGLVYELIEVHNIPVEWAINPNKDYGGVDFVADGKAYSGGSFIIPEDFISQAILDEIALWEAQGVVVDQITTEFSAPIHGTVTNFPRAVLDAANGSIAAEYFVNAGIEQYDDPSNPDPAKTAYILGGPEDLTGCDDIYILPHADPSGWTTLQQQTLNNFISNGGYLWAACHAVSDIENVDIDGDGTFDMNYLSSGLQLWGDHGDGTLPYTYDPNLASHEYMQFMGTFDLATNNGSEQIYIPSDIEGWRPTTTVAVWDPDHPDVLSVSDEHRAALLAFGQAFGDPDAGIVMYEAGHTHAKDDLPDNIAAQRVFFNFLLQTGIDKQPLIEGINLPNTLTVSETGQLQFVITPEEVGSPITTFVWNSTDGGIFANEQRVTDPVTGVITVTIDFTQLAPQTTVTLRVSDDCGRDNTFALQITDPPPILDLDADDSTTVGSGFLGSFAGSGVIVPAADSDVSVLDGGGTIVSATITLTNHPEGSDERLIIDATAGGNVTGVSVTAYNPATGQLILSGTATVADYQAILATLQYQNDLPNPDKSDRIIEVTVNDSFSDSNTAVSTLVFNDAPRTNEDAYFTSTDEAISITPDQGVLANDFETEGDDLTVISYDTAGTAGGTVTMNPDGSFSYEPPAGFTGEDTFTYTVDDGYGNQVTETVHVYVNPATGNTPPDAVHDGPYAVLSNVTTAIPAGTGVLQNDSDPDLDSITVDRYDTTTTSGGTVSMNPDGSFEYTPPPGFVGTDTFTYTVYDGNGGAATATVTVEVSNAPPVAQDDSYLIPADQVLTVNATSGALANDSDPNGNPISVSSYNATTTQGGNVSLNPNGSFSYTPPAGFIGTDYISYTISDGNGGIDSAVIEIEVVGAPEAKDDAWGTDEDLTTPITLDVLTNDTTPGTFDPSTLALSNFSWDTANTGLPQISVNPDGTIAFVPRKDGTYTFDYTVTDSTGQSTTATTTVVVSNPGKSAAAPDAYETHEDQVLELEGLIDNDFYSLPDGSTVVEIKVLPLHGDLYLGTTLVVKDQQIPVANLGSLTYVPDPGYVGPDQIQYELRSDGNSQTLIDINVLPAPSEEVAPVANDDAWGTDRNTTLVLDVLTNDTSPGTFDPSSLVTSNTSWTLGAAGRPVLTLNADGTINFNPNGTGRGTYTFDYTVTDSTGQTSTATVTVIVADPGKTAAAPDSYETTVDATLALVGIVDNDFYSRSDALTSVKIKTLPQHGDLYLNGALVADEQVIPLTSLGNLTYVPDPGYIGADGFDYELASDGTSQTSVAISIVPPVRTENSIDGGNASFETASAFPQFTSPTYAATGLPDGYSIDPNTGEISGASNSDASQGGPNSDGVYTITVIATEGGVSYQTEIELTIENLAPSAGSDNFVVQQDQAYTGSVTGNDADASPDGDMLTYSLTTNVSNGALMFNPDGTFEYTPNPGFSGTDSFNYLVDDGQGGTAEALVTLDVNSPPTATDNTASVTEDGPLIFSGNMLTDDNGSGLDSDPEGDGLSIVEVDGVDPTWVGSVGGSYGTLTFNTSGGYSYSLNNELPAVQALGVGESVVETFDYTVSDGNGGTDTATISVVIHGVNDVPVAQDDPETTDQDTAVSDSVLVDNGNGADSDVDGDTLTVIEVNGVAGDVNNQITLASGALLTLNSDGTYDYDPNGQFDNLGVGQSTNDSFTYTISDGNGGTDTATVTIVINGLNDAPVATDDEVSVDEDSTVAGNLITGDNGNGIDSDPDGDSLTLIEVNGAIFTPGVPVVLPSGAQVTLQPNGTYVYSPNGQFESLGVGESAEDSFTYTVSDGNGGFDTATVTIIVNGANDAPAGFGADGGLAFLALCANYGNQLQVTAGSVLGEFGPAQDTDTNDAHTYRIVDGTGTPVVDPNFEIVGNQFVVKAANSLTPGAVTPQSLIIQVDDGNGGTFEQTFDFNVRLFTGSFIGGNGREMVVGTAGNDTINGGGAVDYLFGGDGNDTLNGDGSYDVLEGGAGADILNGGAGGDTASYFYSKAGVIADLVNSAVNTGDAFGDTYISIEHLRGSQFGDVLAGDATANWIYGFGGDDVITGRGGDDYLFGGEGNDEFVFEDGCGNDGIYDFVAGAGSDDVLNIQSFGFASFAAVQAATFLDADGCVVIQLDADDSVTLHGIMSVASLSQDDFLI